MKNLTCASNIAHIPTMEPDNKTNENNITSTTNKTLQLIQDPTTKTTNTQILEKLQEDPEISTINNQIQSEAKQPLNTIPNIQILEKLQEDPEISNIKNQIQSEAKQLLSIIPNLIKKPVSALSRIDKFTDKWDKYWESIIKKDKTILDLYTDVSYEWGCIYEKLSDIDSDKYSNTLPDM